MSDPRRCEVCLSPLSRVSYAIVPIKPWPGDLVTEPFKICVGCIDAIQRFDVSRAELFRDPIPEPEDS